MKGKLWMVGGMFILVITLVLAMTTVIYGAGGPHDGTFTSTTDACAGCHRAHTAVASKLLQSTQEVLCLSCHDGSGADTDVENGVLVGGTQGTVGAGLRGGGFSYAVMDTNLDNIGTSNATTSTHTMEASGAVVWGSGGLNDPSDKGEVMVTDLGCGNCHNPHGNSNYRILRSMPTGLVTDVPTANVTIEVGLTDDYTVVDTTDNYTDFSGYTSGITSEMSEWCGQCHKRYIAGDSSATTDSTDTVFAFRHETNTSNTPNECLDCHVAHGTSAGMNGGDGYAENTTYIIWPDSFDGVDWQGSENDFSRLLRVDNRGICIVCHSSSELTEN
ncbi:cytochrome c3 family protein [Chloroflexota bacterium]